MVKLLEDHGDDQALAAWLRSFGAGEPIYHAGQPGGELYVVQSGRIELTAGPGTTATQAGPGDVFGEQGLPDGSPRESDARALEPTSVLRVERAMLEALVRQQPELGIALVARVGRRAATLMKRGPSPQQQPPPAPTVETPRAGVARLCGEGGLEFPLPPQDDIVVGRRSGNVVPDIDLTPVDTERSLSRRHARIVRAGELFGLREEPGVLNGTFLNGVRLEAGESPRLKDGDEVRLGLVKLRFRS